MKTALLTLALGSMAIGVPGSSTSAAEVRIPLFDGETLRGWHVTAKPDDRMKAFWSVEAGTITCDSRGREDHDYVWLVSDKEYGDFELELKVRGFRDSSGNSGIQVRSRYDEVSHWMNGPQIDVHPPVPWRTGLIYDETSETRRWIYPSLRNWEIDASHAPKGWIWRYADEGDGWNAVRILCIGLNIRSWLNGVPAADLNGEGILDDDSHRRHDVGVQGHIALQLHARDELYIQYKDLFITTRGR